MKKLLAIYTAILVMALAPALMGPTGGFPSRPKFNSVGVNVAAPAGNGNLTASGTITAANLVGTMSGSGAALTNLNATQLTTGTVPDARFPATLPALSGVNLTALNANNLGSGTVPSARVSGTYSNALTLSSASNAFTGDGSALTALNATQLTTGTVPAARINGATPSGGQFNLVMGSSGRGLLANGATTGNSYWQLSTTTGNTLFGLESSAGNSVVTGAAANASFFSTVASTPLCLGTSSTARLCIDSAGRGAWNAPSSGTALTITSTTSVGDAALNIQTGSIQLAGSDGSAGQILTSAGAHATPTWATNSAASCSSASFTATLTGFTTTVQGTVIYRLCGDWVTLYMAGSGLNGTSNTTTMTMTGLPAAIIPIGGSGNSQIYSLISRMQDASANTTGELEVVGGSSTITFSTCVVGVTRVGCNSNFTNTGTKGFGLGWTLSYNRNTQ